MIYGLALLVFLLGAVTGLTALPKILRMRKIRGNSATTTGFVSGLVSMDSGALGGVVSSRSGKVNYPQIVYRAADDKERSIEVTEASLFNIQRYKAGDVVEVVYDKSAPWLAYAGPEWQSNVRDVWMAGGEILLAGVLYTVGLVFKLPW